jgi:hypothetical protein
MILNPPLYSFLNNIFLIDLMSHDGIAPYMKDYDLP